MKRIPLLLVSLLSVLLLGICMPVSLAATEIQTNHSSEINALQSEVARLTAENAALKRENQSLRQELAKKTEQAAGAATSAPKSPATVAPAQQQTGYWITISSGVRHNSSCRYYMNSKGRTCWPNEGRACKICGG